MLKIIFYQCCIVFVVIRGSEITQLNTPRVDFSHSIYWDDDTQSLYFVNFFTSDNQSSIYRYSTPDEILYSAYIEGVTSPAFIIPTNKMCKKCNKCNKQFFAVGVGSDVIIIKWNGRSTKAKVIKTLFTVDDTSMRFDIGVADSKGRFYGGTLSPKFCNSNPSRSFYRFIKNKGVDRLFGNLQSTSGIVFNEHLNKIYHLDSCQLTISGFDWDPKTGDICNGRVVFKFPLNGRPMSTYFPLGLAINSNGMLFLAEHYTSEVWEINPCYCYAKNN
ncbi:uncharacterized protein LOC116343211 isoform X2 [Contarinia nasturtii]|uniref:uncharacterized protein LOC116343211 isoform X2 n=1 Tax=Contarinia nasturtii TaxID=265458 RepID=UPI0012D4862B|nr:uncharacterized protein LOC116343211 isoform X2 [Contarinia nasturtii]